MNRFLVFFFLLTASLCAQTQERVTLTDGTINYGRTRPMVNGGLSSFSGTNPITLVPGSGLVVSGSIISTTGTASYSGTSGYSVTSGSSAVSGTAGALSATISGTNDYYIVLRPDGKMGSGTLADPYDGSAIQTIHQWTPPGFSTVVTSTCLSRYDAALQSIPAGSGSNAIVIHIGAGVFYTGGIPRLSPSTGLTTGSNAYYNCPQIKDGWVVKGAPGYGTTLRLANNAAQSEPLVSGSDNEWYVIGPIYDSQPGLPDYITRFEIDDLLIDGNVQNQNWGGAGTGAVTAAGLTAQYYSTYRRVQAINCGYTGPGGEIIDFLAARTFNTTGPCYAIIDSCMVSGTVYGSDGDGIVENAGEGNPAINLISTISNCSVTTTGTQTLNIGIAVADGSNSNAYVVNNYVSRCNDGIYSDTGYFDRITVTGNRLIGDGLGITIYGLSASNLLFSNNYITTRQGGNSFFGNTNPASGTITDNTMILDGTASSAGAILNNGGGSGKWIISNNQIGVGMVINTGTAAIYGFGNKFTDGTDVTALNNAGYSSLSGTANYATTSGTAAYAAQSGTSQYAVTSGSAATSGTSYAGPSGAFGSAAYTSSTNYLTSTGTAAQSGTAQYAVSSGSSTVSGSTQLDPLVSTYLTNVAAASGTVSASSVAVINEMVKGVRNDGLLSLIKDWHFPVGEFNASAVKLVTATGTNTVVYTNYTSTNWTETGPNRGLASGGTSYTVSSGVNAAVLSPTNASLVYIRTGGAAANNGTVNSFGAPGGFGTLGFSQAADSPTGGYSLTFCGGNSTVFPNAFQYYRVGIWGGTSGTSALSIYINGTKLANTTAASGTFTSGVIQEAAGPNAVYGGYVIAGALTDAQQNRLAYWLNKATSALGCNFGGPVYSIQFIGDSLWQGYTVGFGQLSSTAFAQLSGTKGLSDFNVNSWMKGVVGQTAGTINSNIVIYQNIERTALGKNIIGLWECTNDMLNAGASAATAFASLKTTCSGLKAVDPTCKIIVTTLFPSTTYAVSGSANYNSQVGTFNASILTDPTLTNGTVANGIVRLDNVPQFQDTTNTTWFQDGLHPTQAGENIVAALETKGFETAGALPGSAYPTFVLTGTLASGTAGITDPRLYLQCPSDLVDTGSSITNLGSLQVSISGSTATINSSSVLDSSTFRLTIDPWKYP